MRTTEQSSERTASAQWLLPSLTSMLALIAVLVGLAGFGIGRWTAPTHRHAVPAPRAAQLNVTAVCTTSIRPADNRRRPRVEVKVHYRSGWPEGEGSGNPNFGLVLSATPRWTFHQPDSEASGIPQIPLWFGFGGSGRNPPEQRAAVRWLQERAREPGWVLQPPLPPDTSGEFYEREGRGSFMFDADVEDAPAKPSFRVLIAMFDIDGTAIERDVSKTC